MVRSGSRHAAVKRVDYGFSLVYAGLMSVAITGLMVLRSHGWGMLSVVFVSTWLAFSFVLFETFTRHRETRQWVIRGSE